MRTIWFGIAILASFTAVYFKQTEQMSSSRKHTQRGDGSRSAIVLGATGATGRQVVAQLLESKEWGKVTTIGRRELPDEPKSEKLNHVVVPDFDKLDSTHTDKWAGHDVVFNCLGTTRSAAGGAENFVRFEVDYTKKAADLAAKSGIKSFSVVSAQGANPNAWYVNWLHPLLYVHTLGMKEEVVKNASHGGFDRVSIFRPGMLNRLMGDRWHENIINYLGLGLRVDDLARAMIRDAESDPPTAKEEPMMFEGNTVLSAMSKGDL